MSMTLISTVNVGSGGAANIQFASIPQTFTDLLLIASTRSTRADFVDDTNFTFGDSGGSTYSFQNRWLRSNGATPTTGSSTANGLIGLTSGNSATASTYGTVSLYLPNYATAGHKLASIESSQENNNAQGWQQFGVSAWSSTLAVFSITLTNAAGNFVVNSTASLYGILRGSGGATVS